MEGGINGWINGLYPKLIFRTDSSEAKSYETITSECSGSSSTKNAKPSLPFKPCQGTCCTFIGRLFEHTRSLSST